MKDVVEILDRIKLELSTMLNAAEYMLWIDGLTPVCVTAVDLVVCAPSDNARMAILEPRMLDYFFDACRRAGLPYYNILPIIESEKHQFAALMPPDLPELIKQKSEREKQVTKKKNPFQERYTFENFVVGDSNRFAFEISKTVAKNPGINDGLLTLNPLFIHGGVGLGKTHLLHSIGNYLYENNPSLNVIYTPTESLTNEYFASLSKYSSDNKDSYRNFREKYAAADVLMLDDVQFLQKKGGLQDVIFHIFNDLYQKGKQIILSSDRPPKDINDIEDRLRSRFEGGIMTDIWTPSLDTRVNIIKKKLESTKADLDEDIIYYLADKINTNIRELEGALMKVIMYSQLNGKRPSLETAKEAMKERDEDKKDLLDSNKIIDAVSEYYGVSRSDILSKKRNKEIVEARMMAIYLVFDILDLPSINVGQMFGGRDHTTALYSRDKIAASLGTNGRNDKAVKDLKFILCVNK